jgi:hypothetical protein
MVDDFLNEDSRKMRKEVCAATLLHCCSTSLKGLRKITRNLKISVLLIEIRNGEPPNTKQER